MNLTLKQPTSMVLEGAFSINLFYCLNLYKHMNFHSFSDLFLDSHVAEKNVLMLDPRNHFGYIDIKITLEYMLYLHKKICHTDISFGT